MKNTRLLSIILILIALGVITLMAASLVMAQRRASIVAQQTIDLQSEVAQRVAKDVAGLINGRENELTLLTKTQNIMQLAENEQVNIISALIASQSAYDELALLNHEGQEIVRVGSLKVFANRDLQYRAAQPEFQEPKMSGRAYYSPMQFDDVTGEPFMIIAVPSFDVQSGAFNGILAARIHFRAIWDLMSGARVPGNGIVYVIDGENRVIAHRDPAIVLQDTHMQLPDNNGFSAGLNGEEAVLAVAANRFGTQEFRTVAEQQTNEVLSLARNDMALTGVVIFMLVTMLIVLIVAFRRIGKA